MTPQGHASLKEELKRLKEIERPRISAEIGVARDHGDLKENAEWHAAREKQSLIEGRILDIEDKLARADVIDPSKLGGSRIKFGARVKLEDSDSGKMVEYRIVGPDESDINSGTISVTSPMAKALIGREVGDEVQVKAPGGVRSYEVVDIAWT